MQKELVSAEQFEQGGSFHVIRCAPGPSTVRSLIKAFESDRLHGRKGELADEGVITSFEDSFLPSCRRTLSETSPISVRSFADIVRHLHFLAGLETKRVAPGAQQIAAMQQAAPQQAALANAEGESAAFDQVAEFAGFARAAVKTMRELHEYGIDADTLRLISNGVDVIGDPLPEERRLSADLAKKVRDLAGLNDRADSILAEIGTTSLSEMVHRSMEEFTTVDGEYRRVLVFAHATYKPVALKWLRWLAHAGCQVTVVVDSHPGMQRGDASGVFEAGKRIVQALGVEPNAIGSPNKLLEGLFANVVPEGLGLEGGVTIQAASDPLSECEWAIRHATKRRQYESVLIFTRNVERYAPLLEIAAKRFGVSLQSSRRAPLTSNGFVRFTLAMLRAIAEDDVRAFGNLLNSSYLQLPAPAKDLLTRWVREAYAEEKLTVDHAWRSLNAKVRTYLDLGGTDASVTSPIEAALKEDVEWLVELTRWRTEHLSVTNTPNDWYRLLKGHGGEQGFLEQARWFRGAALSSELSPRATVLVNSDRDQRAFTAFCGAIHRQASVRTVSEKREIGFKEFLTFVEEICSDADVSLPTPESRIRVTGRAEDAEGANLVIALGMLEGEFPQRRKEDPILSDFDREALSKALELPSPLLTSHDRARAERDVFYRVCALAEKELLLSYPLTEGDSDNVPAFYLEEVRRVLGSSVAERVYPRNVLVDPEELNLSDSELAQGLAGPREEPLDNELLNSSSIEQVRYEENKFSISELRDLNRCPYKFFVETQLRLRPTQSREWYQALRNLPTRALLMNAESPDVAKDRLEEALATWLEEKRFEIPEWEVEIIKSAADRLIESWIEREFKARDLWRTQPGQFRFGVSYAKDPKVMSRLGIELDETVPAIHEGAYGRTLHLYKPRAVKADFKKPEEFQKMMETYGPLFCASHTTGTETRIEVDGLNNRRTMLRFEKPEDSPNRVDTGLRVEAVNILNFGDLNRNQFFALVKEHINQAKAVAAAGKMEARPGDHCEFCTLGDLCRRSQTFGEQSDPFETAINAKKSGGAL